MTDVFDEVYGGGETNSPMAAMPSPTGGDVFDEVYGAAQGAPQSGTGIYEGGISNILSGATFGQGPEILANLSAPLTKLASALPGSITGYSGPTMSLEEAYQSALPDLVGNQEQFRKENPGTALGTSLAGGTALPLPGVNKLFSSAKGLVPAATNITKGSLLGGLLSAVTGFGEGTGGGQGTLDQRLQAADANVLPGLIGGGVLTTGIEGVQGTANKLADVASGAFAKVLGNQGKAKDFVYLDENGNKVFNPEDAATKIPEEDYHQQTLQNNGFFKNLGAFTKPEDVSLALDKANQGAGEQIGSLVDQAQVKLLEDGKLSLPKDLQPDFSPLQDYVDSVGKANPSQGASLQKALDALKENWSSSDKSLSALKEFQQSAGKVQSAFEGSADANINKAFTNKKYGVFAEALQNAFDSVLPEQAGNLRKANELYQATSEFNDAAYNVKTGLLNAINKNVGLSAIPQSGLALALSHVLGPLPSIAYGGYKAAKILGDTNPLAAGKIADALSRVLGGGRGLSDLAGALRPPGAAGGGAPTSSNAVIAPEIERLLSGQDSPLQLGPGNMKALPWDMEAGQGFTTSEPSPARGLPAGQGFTNRDINLEDLLSGQKLLPNGEAAPLALPPGQGFTMRDPTIRDLLSKTLGLPGPEERLLLPSGQGFTVRNPTLGEQYRESPLTIPGEPKPNYNAKIIPSSGKATVGAMATTGGLAALLSTVLNKGGTKMDNPETPKILAANRIVPKTDEEALAQIKSDPFTHAVALTESSMNPNAKADTSSAEGIFQFTKGTAADYGLKDRTNIPESLKAFQDLTKDNAKVIGSNDPLQLYMAHVLGAGLAKKVLNQDSLSDKEQKLVNYFFVPDEKGHSPYLNFKKNYELVSRMA